MVPNVSEKSRGECQRSAGLGAISLTDTLEPSVRATEAWETTVFDRFYEIVHRFPHAIAISDDHASMTYAELWNFAAAFRSRLVAQGIRPGDLVGIAAGRSPATAAAILGVTMAGGCYVPIGLEEFPAATLDRLIEQNGLCHWIADAPARKLSDSLVWTGRAVLALENVLPISGVDPVEVPAPAIHPESPLYVMFTSGSTGLPKGVVVPHRAVARLVTGQNFLEFGPQHTFLLHSPLSFDASTLELWGSLLHGGRLAVAPDRRLGLDDYAQLLDRMQVTTLWLTAAIFHLAAEHMPEIFAPLRQLLFGGDVIAPRYVERIRAMYPNLRMVNGYGPTENTTFTCCYVVPSDYRAQGSLPIGSPISHTAVHILNADRRQVDAGQEGELAAGGAGVALGYLAQPEATAERFIPDTFSANENAKIYLTGDRVRQRPDGVLEFLGRVDSQIKIAGHRVELDQVEAAISSFPLVAEAAVVVLSPASGEKQLVACVSLTHTDEDAETQLRQWLEARIARVAIPQHWLFLDRLPVNANGKLDRNALRAKCDERFSSRIATRAQLAQGNLVGGEVPQPVDMPRVMGDLQRLWAGLLGQASIGSDESFFDLGGTSLLLIEMHARLKAQFASTPSLVDMFSFPTPRLLAKRLVSDSRTPLTSNHAEQRGQRQRAAMLARRAAQPAAREDVAG